MKQGLDQGLGATPGTTIILRPEVTIGVAASVAASQAIMDLTREAIAMDENEASVERDEAEAHEIEARGDSDAVTPDDDREGGADTDAGIDVLRLEGDDGDLVALAFERDGTAPARDRWLAVLPRFARPPVLFAIEPTGELRDLVALPDNENTRVMRAIGAALATRAKQGEVALAAPLAWCQVAAFGTVAALAESLPKDLGKLLVSRQRHVPELKEFAIAFPDGSVVKPMALVRPARMGGRASCAAALRLSGQRPDEIAGEKWTEDDWKRFEHAQGSSKGRREKAHGGGKRQRTAR
jgi:hypothetical protein